MQHCLTTGGAAPTAWLRRVLFALPAIVLALIPSGVDAQPKEPTKVRTAELLFPMAIAIRSSSSPGAGPFVIGILGKDPFDKGTGDGNYLDEVIAARNAAPGEHRKIVVKRFDSAAQVTPVDILFISSENTPTSAERSAAERMQAAKKLAEKSKDERPMLLMSYEPGFAAAGVPVNFYDITQRNGKVLVLVELNPTAAKATGFDTIEASLYRLISRGFGRIVR